MEKGKQREVVRYKIGIEERGGREEGSVPCIRAYRL